MTYTSDLNDYNIPEVVLEQICEEGFDARLNSSGS